MTITASRAIDLSNELANKCEECGRLKARITNLEMENAQLAKELADATLRADRAELQRDNLRCDLARTWRECDY